MIKEILVSRKYLKSWPGLRGKPLRFVVLRHMTSDKKFHYDLLLEMKPNGDDNEKALLGLKCTRIRQGEFRQILWRTHGRRRRLYLTFEGDIGKQRGVVKRVDEGTYIVRKRRGILLLSIDGKMLRGHFSLQRPARGTHLWAKVSSSTVLI